MKEFFLCARFHISWSHVLSICFYHSSSGKILTIKLDEARQAWSQHPPAQPQTTDYHFILLTFNDNFTSPGSCWHATTNPHKSYNKTGKVRPCHRRKADWMENLFCSELWFKVFVRPAGQWGVLYVTRTDCVLKNHLSLKNCVCCQVADVLKIINELID